jgi:DNA-binding NarL/FixJ family response regulator
MTRHLHLVAPSREASEAKVRIVLADDHVAVRRSLRRLLDRHEDFEVVAEAGDFSTVVRELRRHAPDVVVLDLEMPNGSAIETIRQLRAEVPRAEIVVLTMRARPGFARQAIAAGAIAFVLKERAAEDLPSAVRCAVGGEEYVSGPVAPQLDDLRRGAGDDVLRPRDVELLRLLALGHTSREVADELGVAQRAIESRRARMYRELNLRTRADLVRCALDRHLMDRGWHP